MPLWAVSSARLRKPRALPALSGVLAFGKDRLRPAMAARATAVSGAGVARYFRRARRATPAARESERRVPLPRPRECGRATDLPVLSTAHRTRLLAAASRSALALACALFRCGSQVTSCEEHEARTVASGDAELGVVAVVEVGVVRAGLVFHDLGVGVEPVAADDSGNRLQRPAPVLVADRSRVAPVADALGDGVVLRQIGVHRVELGSACGGGGVLRSRPAADARELGGQLVPYVAVHLLVMRDDLVDVGALYQFAELPVLRACLVHVGLPWTVGAAAGEGKRGGERDADQAGDSGAAGSCHQLGGGCVVEGGGGAFGSGPPGSRALTIAPRVSDASRPAKISPVYGVSVTPVVRRSMPQCFVQRGCVWALGAFRAHHLGPLFNVCPPPC